MITMKSQKALAAALGWEPTGVNLAGCQGILAALPAPWRLTDEPPRPTFDNLGREMRLDGPVVVIESETDPGDLGEPRVFAADGVTYLCVPPASAWPSETDDTPLTLGRLARALQDAEDIAAKNPHPGYEAWARAILEALRAES